ncbi:MAG: hypothetical protein GY869_26010 [Planctomycetes bacterium]|nr:hypothetical protein [Planctomycetota bacterium]
MRQSAIVTQVFYLLVLAVFVSAVSAQDMSTAFTYQGKFSEAGMPAQGVYDFVFALYYAPDAPTTKHFNKLESVAVEGGFFTVELNYGHYLFGSGSDFWMGVFVRPGELADPNEYTELLPRQKLTPTPYAIYAGNAGEVAYGSSITGSGTINYLPKFTDTFSVGDSLIFEAGGNIGIGTSSPGEKLQVNGAVNISKTTGPHLIINDTNGSNDRPGIQFTNNNIHYIGGDDGSDEYFGFYSQYSSTRTNDTYFRVYGSAASSWGTYIGLSHDGFDGKINTDVGDIILEPSGYVGIGTNAPDALLDVTSNGIPAATIGASATTATGIHAVALGANADATNNYTIAMGTGVTASGLYATAIGTDITVSGNRSVGIGLGTAATVTASNVKSIMGGSVGIGTTGPSYKLDVSGDIECTTLHETSDVRLKKDIQPLTEMLGKVGKLRGVSFQWKQPDPSKNADANHKHIGVIAQEVETVFPELVAEDDQGYKSVEYTKLTAVLIEAVKELKAENEQLKQRLEILENK